MSLTSQEPRPANRRARQVTTSHGEPTATSHDMQDAIVMISDTGNNGHNTRTVGLTTSYANTRVNEML